MTDLTVKGRNGQLHFDGNTVTITRDGFVARAQHGRGTRSLPIRSIAAVELKPNTALTVGYIKFSIPGEVTSSPQPGRGKTYAATTNDNAVLFVKKVQPEFEAFAKAVQDAISNYSPNATSSAAEQLTQLADLHSKGVLSDEEFATAKAKALA